MMLMISYLISIKIYDLDESFRDIQDNDFSLIKKAKRIQRVLVTFFPQNFTFFVNMDQFLAILT